MDFADQPALVKVVGPLHGFLFMVYLVTALDIGVRLRWPWLKLGRFDRPAGIWLLMLPGWQGIALAAAGGGPGRNLGRADVIHGHFGVVLIAPLLDIFLVEPFVEGGDEVRPLADLQGVRLGAGGLHGEIEQIAFSTRASLQRFEREVQHMSQLTHPNTVHIYDLGEALAMRDFRKHTSWYLTGYPVGGEARRAFANISAVGKSVPIHTGEAYDGPGTALVPAWLAFSVIRLLEEHFPRLVDYAFTAEMEDVLDEIARGEAERVPWLRRFYFGADGDSADPGLKSLVGDISDIDAREVSSFPLAGSDIVVRVGRYGPYLERDGQRVNVPEDIAPDELTVEKAEELFNQPNADVSLGTDPGSGREVVAKAGRFGPYVTELLPEDAPSSAKPRTASLLKSMALDTVTLDDALKLLSLPRTLGELDGEQVTVQNGRYGPYVKKGTDSRSLESEEQLFTLTLAEEVDCSRGDVIVAAGDPPQAHVEAGLKLARQIAPLDKDGNRSPAVTA